MFGPMAVAQAPAADGYNLNEAVSTHLWKVQRGQGLPVAEKADSVPLERVLNHFHHAIYLRHAQHAHLVMGTVTVALAQWCSKLICPQMSGLE